MISISFSKNDLNLNELRRILLKNGRNYLVLDDLNSDINEDNLRFLNSCGVVFENVIYRSNHLKYYRQFASTLLQEKKAFCCFCRDKVCKNCKNLDDNFVIENENPFKIRLKNLCEKVSFLDFHDKMGSFFTNEVDDFEILNEQKYPSEEFANAIDRMILNKNTLFCHDKLKAKKELLILKSLKYETIQKIVFEKDTFKNISCKELEELGYLPKTIANFALNLDQNSPLAKIAF